MRNIFVAFQPAGAGRQASQGLRGKARRLAAGPAGVNLARAARPDGGRAALNGPLLADGLVKDLGTAQAAALLAKLCGSIRKLGGFTSVLVTGAHGSRMGSALVHLPRTVEVLCPTEKPTAKALWSLAM